MNRLLIALGALLLLAGVLWPWLQKVPWFHLPGDEEVTPTSAPAVAGSLQKAFVDRS